MYEACSAMASFMEEIGVSVDGGKDSLSMAARVGEETVKAPGAQSLEPHAARARWFPPFRVARMLFASRLRQARLW